MLLKNYKRIHKLKVLLTALWIVVSWFFLWWWYNNKITSWNIVILLDLSHSMNTQDMLSGWIQVSRIDVAQSIMSSTTRENKSKKIWLILFADRATYHIPPTYDHKKLLNIYTSLHTNMIPAQWSNISQALNYAASTSNNNDTIILITDGWETDNMYTGSLANELIIIWVGTQNGGVVRDANGTIYKNSNGEPHLSSRNTDYLKQLQEMTNASMKLFEKNSNETITLLSSSWSSNNLRITPILIFAAIFAL